MKEYINLDHDVPMDRTDEPIVAVCCGRRLGELHAEDCEMYTFRPLDESVQIAVRELGAFVGPNKNKLTAALLAKICSKAR